MDPNRNQDVKKTIEIFDMKIDSKMLPGGTNPKGIGNLLANSENGLAMADLSKLVLGDVKPQTFKTEEGNEAMMEKMNSHARAFGRVRQASAEEGTSSDIESVASFATGFSTQTSTVGDIAGTWDEITVAINKGKFNARKLKAVRNELDELMRKTGDENDSIASSNNSISTWASFAPPTKKPIEKYIEGYEKLSLEDKIETLKKELPPFNIEDYKYNNLKYALGQYHN